MQNKCSDSFIMFHVDMFQVEFVCFTKCSTWNIMIRNIEDMKWLISAIHGMR